MEEIKLGFMLNDDSIGLGLFQELIEKSQERGVQIGVPWTGSVYNYLFEEGVQNGINEIFSGLYDNLTEDSYF